MPYLPYLLKHLVPPLLWRALEASRAAYKVALVWRGYGIPPGTVWPSASLSAAQAGNEEDRGDGICHSPPGALWRLWRAVAYPRPYHALTGIFRTQHLLFFFGLVDQSNLVPQA